MKVNAAARILVVAGLCAASLIGLVISEGAARQAGQEIVLPMAAVDPRELLSGHYVRIQITERLAPGEPCPEQDAAHDWLAFAPSGAVHVLVGSAASREDAQQVGPVPAKGTFTCSPGGLNADGTPGAGAVWIDLGIDRFYINQADALRIERAMREQQPGGETRVFVIVSIGRDGQARLMGVMVDGERLDLNWL